MHAVDPVVLEDLPAHEILALLVKKRREANSKYSLNYLARRAKIANRSNLSEMLSGKRRVPKKYWESLLDALGVIGLGKTLMLKRLEVENSKGDKQTVYEEIQILRKALTIRTIEEEFFVSMGAFKLFCGLSLLPPRNGAGKENPAYLLGDLKKLLGWRDEHIARCLRELEQVEAIERRGELIRILNNKVLFSLKGESQQKIGSTMIKRFLNDTIDHIDRSFYRSDSLFSSSVVAIDSKKLDAELDRLGEALTRFQSTVEAAQADQLISVNLQVFPLDLSQKQSPHE